MITRLSLNPKKHILTPEQELNLQKLMDVCQKIEDEFGSLLVINRGFSTAAEQRAIYDVINAGRKVKGLPPVKVPMGSAHMKAAAADISDVTGALYKWLESKLDLRTQLGMAMEDKAFTPTWCHVQTYLPSSGHLIFKPY